MATQDRSTFQSDVDSKVDTTGSQGTTGQDVIDLLDNLSDSALFLEENDSITGQPSFSPGTAQAPFTLNANAQQQTVTGLRADEIPASYVTSPITGGDGTALGFDEAQLKDGGAKELDVADLAGGLGTAGQVVTTDGAAVSWGAVGSAGIATGAVGTSEIATDAVGVSEIDLSITPTWTGQHVFNAGIDIEGDWDVTSVAEAGVDRLLVEGAGVDDPAELMLQAKGASNVARFTATPDASTANFSGITLESNGTHQAIDSIAEGTATALPVQIQMEGTALMEFTTGNAVQFNAITGTPTFGGHDHSAGGMAAVSGIATDAVGNNELNNADAFTFNGNLTITSDILDTNGNEQITFTSNASAVNHLDVANAASGNAPTIAAKGGDTDINLKIAPKGTGSVVFDKWKGTAGSTTSWQQGPSFQIAPFNRKRAVFHASSGITLTPSQGSSGPFTVDQSDAGAGILKHDFDGILSYTGTAAVIGKTSQVADLAEIAGTVRAEGGTRSASPTIADDGVANVSPDRNIVMVFVEAGGESGVATLDIGSGAIVNNFYTTANLDFATGSHSGTTGTDTNFTVAADGTNTQIDLENRTGASVTATLMIIG